MVRTTVASGIVFAVVLAVLFKKFRSNPKPKAKAKPDHAADVSTEGQGYDYEVFLSFRGSDTRHGFTDFLYHALIDAGVRAFRDDEELRTGEEIGPNLLKAIGESKICIPILSKNYASSKWCLKELTFMLECKEKGKHMMLPVFYDVTPTEVQDQTGVYGSALRKHMKRYNPETVEEWRAALTKVGQLKGMDLVKMANGYEGQLKKLIVTQVLRELKKANLIVTNNLVGMDDHVVDVKQLLHLGVDDVRILGIWGLGGIGKTTLAKVIYNQILGDFELCSFINNIREESRRDGLMYLQSSLVANLSRCERPHFTSVDEGIHLLKDRYQGKKVLIVLDDIDDSNQLDALVVRRDSFGIGSRIIITTRNKQVLGRVEVDCIYEAKAMNQDHALKLFCKHAFRKDTPKDELSSLSCEIVETTGGLPLALEVIGSILSGESRIIWETTLKKLKMIPNEKVVEKLWISFDALDHEEKQIFLDIACLFIGEDKNNAVLMWEDCKFFPEIGINALIAKSLVKIGDNNEIWMHDQVRDLGREIVRKESYNKPEKRSRLWHSEEAKDVLSNRMGTRKVQAIILDCEMGPKPYVVTSDKLKGISDLRYLELGNAILHGDFEGQLPKLRWLGWHGHTESYVLPPSLNVRKLVVLDLSKSSMNGTWNGWDILKDAKKLEVLDLTSCHRLKRTPDFSSFTSMKRLILRDCAQLDKIDPSVGDLTMLISLDVRNCRRLKSLPENLGSLGQLNELLLDESFIEEIPDNLGGLTNLETFSAKSCKLLRQIPKSFEGLPHLHTLDLEGCVKLQSLPRLPVSLVDLKVTLTCSLVTVPNLADLINLKHLQLQHLDEPLSSTLDYIKPGGYEYEVFLSSRGGLDTTPKSFTDVLYKRLTEVGVRAFRDDEDLREGEEVDPNIVQAINQSKILIPIFSKGYASSKWCLMEAAKMVECMETRKHEVFPIFFDVTPDDVENQTGCYAQAFSEHIKSKKHDASIIEGWRNALKRIGARKGLRVGTSSSSSWGRILQEVVSRIFQELKKPYLDVYEKLVGLDHMERVIGSLDAKANDVRMTGLYGIGGIGKTSIAKFILNQLADKFEYRGFLLNIRGTSVESERFIALQTQLASDILRYRFEKFSSHSEGKSVLSTRLREKKVLILIDDVDQTRQLDYLVGDSDWFGPGSRIFVTTRDVDVLRKSKVEWIEYEVEGMSSNDALLLFCKHAFRQDSPPPEFYRLSLAIVEATQGIPLSIQAVGSSLSITRDEKVWRHEMNNLKTEKDLNEKLKLSYNALNHKERQVFLDIACLFNGADYIIPLHMWKKRQFNPKATLDDLLMRSLIQIRDDNVLWMHHSYVVLGREIVRQGSHNNLEKQSRLWCSKDAIEVLEAKKGSEEVKAIHLDRGSDSENCCFSHQHFEKLSCLEFLELGDASLSGDFEGCLSSLLWLSWHGRNLLDTPTGLHLKNLLILDLSKSDINSDWEGWSIIKEAENLEVLNLSGCHQLTRTPIFSTFLRMKRLILEDCQGLVEVSPSIEDLENLEFLNLRNCSSLKKLPEELGSMVALIELLLDGSSIIGLPISRGMKRLKILSAKSCRSLTDISANIGLLESLEELNLSECGGVRYLHDSIQNLSNLKVLTIDHCGIGKLPVSLWKLRKLEVINASDSLYCQGEIPSDLGSLNSLEVLRLDRTGVTSLPDSIIRLPFLRVLDLKDCMDLQSVPTLPSSLVQLKVTLTSSVIKPDLHDLVNLKELELVYYGDLSRVLMYIEKFSKIEKLTITKRYTQYIISLRTLQ